jgi:alkanesulfonate monooxygenase SsuD/methylene tetrahydromethanopterin reductase-like flavin-dependent oxidoreductase (luciferase family)
VADVVFTAQPVLADQISFYGDLKTLANGYGRRASDVIIMPGICPIVAASEQQARQKLDELNSLIDIGTAMMNLANFMNDVDLSQYGLDELVSDIPLTQVNQSRQKVALDLARRENLTLRQLALKFSGTRGHWMPVGTPEHIADQMELYFDSYGADGFNVLPATFPGRLQDFVELVVPELQRRGRFRTEYQGDTLRENLGLARIPFLCPSERSSTRQTDWPTAKCTWALTHALIHRTVELSYRK